jgi:hypothetical protein
MVRISQDRSLAKLRHMVCATREGLVCGSRCVAAPATLRVCAFAHLTGCSPSFGLASDQVPNLERLTRLPDVPENLNSQRLRFECLSIGSWRPPRRFFTIWLHSATVLNSTHPMGVFKRYYSCRTTVRSDLLILIPPLYSMKPSLLNLFMNKFTRERVVPIISASVSWETF